jgi:hypothetical protein
MMQIGGAVCCTGAEWSDIVRFESSWRRRLPLSKHSDILAHTFLLNTRTQSLLSANEHWPCSFSACIRSFIVPCCAASSVQQRRVSFQQQHDCAVIVVVTSLWQRPVGVAGYLRHFPVRAALVSLLCSWLRVGAGNGAESMRS